MHSSGYFVREMPYQKASIWFPIGWICHFSCFLNSLQTVWSRHDVLRSLARVPQPDMFGVVQGAQGCQHHSQPSVEWPAEEQPIMGPPVDHNRQKKATACKLHGYSECWDPLVWPSNFCYIFIIIFEWGLRSAVLLQRVYPVGWLGVWGWLNSDSFKHRTLFTTKHGLDLTWPTHGLQKTRDSTRYAFLIMARARTMLVCCISVGRPNSFW